MASKSKMDESDDESSVYSEIEREEKVILIFLTTKIFGTESILSGNE